MIRSFKDRATRRFFEGKRVPAFQGFADQAVRRLTILDSADALQDLAGLPSNRLEALHGDRAGPHSIRINAQWRVCFRWAADGPHDVEIVDYHSERLGLKQKRGASLARRTPRVRLLGDRAATPVNQPATR